MWHVFGAEKVSVNTPQFTINPPQLHHKNTTLKTQVFAKPPAKTAFHHGQKNNTFACNKVPSPLVKS
jgi:hypothetical protein